MSYDQAQWGERRRRRWSPPRVTVLILLVLSVPAFAWYTSHNSDQIQDLTVATWSCAGPVDGDMSWPELRGVGCEPADVDADILLFERNGSRPPDTVEAGRHVFEAVGTAVPALSLQVDLADPADSAVLLADVDPEPEVLRSMNGDAAGTRWTSHLDANGRASFLLLISPEG